MADLTNSVNPLSWNVPIVDSRGNPTPEFQRKWEQQAGANASIPDLTTAAAVSAVLDEIGATRGSLLSRGASQWGALAIGGANTILHSDGTDPSWSSLSSLMDTLGGARGDVLFRGAAGWTALVPGAAGNVLTTGGAGADPSWTAAAGGGAAVSSVNDDGTNFYMALMDVDGQLILDGSGDPVFLPEVLPAASIPVDGTTIQAVGGFISQVLNTLPAFSADLNGVNQAVGAGTALINLSHVSFDTRGWFDTVNHRYKPLVAGKYVIIGYSQPVESAIAAGDGAETFIFKNGAFLAGGTSAQSIGTGTGSLVFTIVDMNGTTDYVDLQAYGTANRTAIRGLAAQTYMCGFLLPSKFNS